MISRSAAWKVVFVSALSVLIAAVIVTTRSARPDGNPREDTLVQADRDTASLSQLTDPLMEPAEDSRSEVLTAEAAPADERTWRPVANWAGARGLTQTARFAIAAGEWRISWQSGGASPRTPCALAVYVFDDAGDFITLAANRSGGGAGETYLRTQPGSFYLSVAACLADWDIAVEEFH